MQVVRRWIPVLLMAAAASCGEEDPTGPVASLLEVCADEMANARSQYGEPILVVETTNEDASGVTAEVEWHYVDNATGGPFRVVFTWSDAQPTVCVVRTESTV